MRSTITRLVAAALVVLGAADARAQTRRVTGRVLSTAGEPLATAGVTVQGTTIGTYTAEDGRFILTAPDGPQVLVVRRLGYKRSLLALSGTQTEAEVRLERDVLQLEAQVVTGTATTIARANAANAVTSINADELTKAPVPVLEQGLQGKIPGAVITQNSGAPGGGMQVQMRGVTSMNAAASPLYVVDGVLVSNASIGSGLNSVTNAGGGITSNQDQPVNRIADLNPADIEAIEVLKGASAGAIYGSKASNGVIIITTKRGAAGRPQLSVTQRVGTFRMSHKLGLRCFKSEQEATTWYQDYVGGDALPSPWSPTCHDFEEELYGASAPSYETDLSIRGGTGGTSYYVGGLAKRDNAIQQGSYYQKQALTANVGQTIGSRVTLRASSQFVHSLTDRGISGNDNAPVVSPGDIFSYTPTFFDLKSGARNPYIGEGSNPFQNASLVKNPEDVFRYIGSANVAVSAYASARQTLDLTALGGVDLFSYNSRLLSPPEAYFEPVDGLAGTMVTNKTTSVFANLNLSGAHKLIASPFTATTSFGFRQEYRDADAVLNQGRNLPAGSYNVALAATQALVENRSRIRDQAFYVQEELLTWRERLLLTAALNAERSSVNGDADRYFRYPKLAASLRLPWLPPRTEELKLRMAWGRAGNQPPFGFAFNTLPTGVYDGAIGARNSQTIGNPDIRPETSTELEGGVDLSFFRGRAGLEATVFEKKVTDLILQAALAPSTGYTTAFVNGGALRNTGTEVGLTLVPVQTARWSWTSRTTYANVDSRVTQLDVPCFNAGSFFSLRYGAPFICKGNSVTAVQVYDGWDTTSTSPLRRTRHLATYESAPDFTMGFSNDVTVGPLRLAALVDWRHGGKAVNLTNLYFDPVNLLADTATSQARFGRYNQGYGAYLEDAGFVKLRELTVNYALPRSMVRRAFGDVARDVRVELSGRNLHTWTKYTGYDPEVSNFGNANIGRFQDVTPYPSSRSYFLSLSATF